MIDRRQKSEVIEKEDKKEDGRPAKESNIEWSPRYRVKNSDDNQWTHSFRRLRIPKVGWLVKPAYSDKAGWIFVPDPEGTWDMSCYNMIEG